jgi:hypothetical protein
VEDKVPPMTRPEMLRQFGCAEYFGVFSAGRYSAQEHLWFIVPATEIEFYDQNKSMVIGRAGVDGICFCYRAEDAGIWVFYPMFGEWKLISATLQELERGWLEGSISV